MIRMNARKVAVQGATQSILPKNPLPRVTAGLRAAASQNPAAATEQSVDTGSGQLGSTLHNPSSGRTVIAPNPWNPAVLAGKGKGLAGKVATPGVDPRVGMFPRTPGTSGLSFGELQQLDGPGDKRGGLPVGTPNDPGMISDIIIDILRRLERTYPGSDARWELVREYAFWRSLYNKLLQDPRYPGPSSPNGAPLTTIPVSPLGKSDGTRGNDVPLNGMPLPPGAGSGQGEQGGDGKGGDGKGGAKSDGNGGGDGNSGGNGGSSNNGQSTGESQHGTAGTRESHDDSGGGDDDDGGGDGGDGEGGGNGGESGGSGPADVGEAIDDVQREWERSDDLPPADGSGGGGNDVGGLKLPKGSRDTRPAIQQLDVRTGPSVSLMKTKTGPDDKYRPDTGQTSGGAGATSRKPIPALRGRTTCGATRNGQRRRRGARLV